jgi:hypothetical protein
MATRVDYHSSLVVAMLFLKKELKEGKYSEKGRGESKFEN